MVQPTMSVSKKTERVATSVCRSLRLLGGCETRKSRSQIRAGLLVIRAFAVIALFVSLNVGLKVRWLELILATEGGFIATVSALIEGSVQLLRWVPRIVALFACQQISNGLAQRLSKIAQILAAGSRRVWRRTLDHQYA